MDAQKKRALIVCTTFSPKNAVGAIRLTKFTKYLIRAEWDVTIITVKVENEEILDGTLFCNELKTIDLVRLSYSNFLLDRKRNKSQNSKTSDNSENLHKNLNIYSRFKAKCYSLLYTLKQYSWYLQCWKWINSNYKPNEFDVVFSSYPGIAAHWVAEYVRDRNIAKKWVADFRDPMAYKELNDEKEYKRRLKQQKRIVLAADAVTAVSRALYSMMKQMAGDNEKPVYFIPNGYDRDDFAVSGSQTSIDSGPRYLSFVYTGSLYGGKRNIEVIFKVLRELVDENLININDIVFNYAGKEFYTLHKQAQKYGLENILVNHGFISREKSISLQIESSINVVCTWNNGDYHGVIPGKIYESLLLQKPTIAIINGDSCRSEVAEIIRSTRIGVAFEEANKQQDYTTLKQYIQDFYTNLVQNGIFEFSPNLDAIKKYDYENLTNELEKAFLEVLCKQA